MDIHKHLNPTAGKEVPESNMYYAKGAPVPLMHARGDRLLEDLDGNLLQVLNKNIVLKPPLRCNENETCHVYAYRSKEINLLYHLKG